MSFIKTWAPYFKSSVRMRGRAIQAAGRVRLLPPLGGEPGGGSGGGSGGDSGGGDLVRAHVQGSELYTVTIHGSGPTSSLHCTCPHFSGGAYCKHIWATLLDLKYQLPQVLESHATTMDTLKPPPPKASKRTGETRRERRGEPEWVGRLSLLRPPGYAAEAAVPAVLPTAFQVCYAILSEASQRHRGLIVELRQRTPTSNGWSRPRAFKISVEAVATLPEPEDRELCATILGATAIADLDSVERYGDDRARGTFRIPNGAWRSTLRRLIQSGRCFLESEDPDRSDSVALQWDGQDAAEPWVLWMVGTPAGRMLNIGVELRRGEQRLAIHRPALILGGSDGLMVYDGVAAPFDDREAFRWVTQFRDDLRHRGEAPTITVPLEEIAQFLDRLYALPQLPEIDLPADIGRVPQSLRPIPHMELFSPGAGGVDLSAGGGRQKLTAKVWFMYGSMKVKPGEPGRFVTATRAAIEEPARDPAVAEPISEDDAASRTSEGAPPVRRDLRLENEAMAMLVTLGFRQYAGNGIDTLTLGASQMPRAVMELLARHWRVLADRRVIRHAGPPRLSVASGIDWFELRGSIHYETEQGGFDVGLPEILAAARSGRHMIELGDGSQALLPEQWLAEHGLITTIGRLEGDHLRFKSSQAALLDALLHKQDLAEVDERFEQIRQRLRQFDGIEPRDASPTFRGSLRNYQREALGWFEFLRWFSIGGILADDMGLGKTVQVLAMFEARYGEAASGVVSEGRQIPRRPSLIVVPRSVVFNWIDEAARFAPALRVQAYTGAEREAMRQAFSEHDIIVTSYGLMRRDIEALSEHLFDYVVLDEAQAIKNPNSQSAKVARLLKADHRLALTGTPVENHLGDLWSIFEFLNPGMLGSNTRFGQLIRSGSVQRVSLGDVAEEVGEEQAAFADAAPSAQASWQIAQALRPFILRRTKRQVLQDLPEKTEQTILCEMEPEQRKVYDQLRDHYRGTLLRQFNTAPGNAFTPAPGASILAGGGGSAMMVLEALLRLRQVACHPGLIDPAKADEPSAKLEALLDSLTELIDEGYKALVFSQFTSMLALVRNRLDKMGVKYAYLDGRTRDRREIVDRFQTDEKCPVFLISLKAGGLGLNLTAAEYVFILDPWWNPAVEQQAIDRTHRIGQTRHVFAYRMICQDTIEQRIAQLQEKKKKLADAIVDGQKSLLRTLTTEDLEMLLS